MAGSGGFSSPAASARSLLPPSRGPGYARRMTAITSTAPAVIVPEPAPRNRVGVVAFILVPIVLAAPNVVAI